jgi:pyruvate formate-lyase activating enzyme-like uncharacterized protein
MSEISIRVGIPPKQWEVDGLHETHRIWRDKQALLEQENVALKAQLAAHAEVVKAAKGVIESARLWSSQNYPTFDRIELEVTEALAAALAKLEAPNVEDTA